MTLFTKGEFILNSGKQSDWKIDCDALRDQDLQTIAYLLHLRLPSFNRVVGIPRGGLRLAYQMERYVDVTSNRLLVVDDVLTTGNSMNKFYKIYGSENTLGAVIFQREDICPEWIYPLFILND